jgi:hypothetical protein
MHLTSGDPWSGWLGTAGSIGEAVDLGFPFTGVKGILDTVRDGRDGLSSPSLPHRFEPPHAYCKTPGLTCQGYSVESSHSCLLHLNNDSPFFAGLPPT